MSIIIKWFLRSWIQMKIKNKVLYIDPSYVSTYFLKHPNRIEFSKFPDEIDGLPEDLEKADLILITHGHKDHCKRVTVNHLIRPDTLILGPKPCVKEIEKGLKIIQPGNELNFDDLKIKVVDAYNTPNGSSTKKVHKKGDCVGYVIFIDNKKIYHSGDTDFIPEMTTLGDIDLALLPIGGTFTMDLNDAINASLAIKPKVVIPIHHLKADSMEFYFKMREHSNIEVKLLRIGEEFVLE